MKTAIVTGAAGFIGAHLVAELLAHGVEVAALCRPCGPHADRLPPGVGVFYGMDELPAADVFYHLAWAGASGPGRGDSLLQTQNAALTLEALRTARGLGCGRFVALGTIYERLAAQIAGADGFSGSGFYILSKRYARDMADQLAHKLGLDFAWCTVCHPIGRYIKPEQLMAYAVSGLTRGEKPVFGPAETLYDMVAVEDAARGLRLLGQAAGLTRRAYYIGSGTPKPLYAWLTEARDALGGGPLGIGERPDDGLRFEREWFDITPLREETGYRPAVSFRQAVRNVAKWVNQP